jgi:hypothetical protein
VEERGKAAGEGVAEDETVMLYCARVTQRYVEMGKVRVAGRSRAFGYGCHDRGVVGSSGGHGEVETARGGWGEGAARPGQRQVVTLAGQGPGARARWWAVGQEAASVPRTS